MNKFDKLLASFCEERLKKIQERAKELIREVETEQSKSNSKEKLDKKNKN